MAVPGATLAADADGSTEAFGASAFDGRDDGNTVVDPSLFFARPLLLPLLVLLAIGESTSFAVVEHIRKNVPTYACASFNGARFSARSHTAIVCDGWASYALPRTQWMVSLQSTSMVGF